MKTIAIAFLLIICGLAAFSQTRQIIRADSVYIQRDGGNGELILLNSTRDSTGGVLSNVGNGRTKFLKARILNDSMVVIGGDTLSLYHKKIPDDSHFTMTAADCKDTAFDDAYGIPIQNFYRFTNTNLIGSRVHVYQSGWTLIPDSDEYKGGWWMDFKPNTGTITIYQCAGCGGCRNPGTIPFTVSQY